VRWRRRLYLFQSADRLGVLGGRRPELQPQEPANRLPERHRQPRRLCGFQVSVQGAFRRPGRLLLPAAHPRPRPAAGARRFQIARRRARAADRLPLSGRRPAGLPEPEGLRRVRGREPRAWLEPVADVLDLAEGAGARGAAQRHGDEVATSRRYWTTVQSISPICISYVEGGRASTRALRAGGSADGRSRAIKHALYGVKWRNFKMVMYLQRSLTEPSLKLATPHIINLTVDPKERKAVDLPYI